MSILTDSETLDMIEAVRAAAAADRRLLGLRSFMAGACPEALAAYDAISGEQPPPDPARAERLRIADALEARAAALPVKYSPTHTLSIERAVLQYHAEQLRTGGLV